MAVEYTNRKHKIYYLHEGKTKKGNPKYYFSPKKDGNLIDKIPSGYEIYEHPSNGMVLLCKKQPLLIADTERRIVQKYLKKIKSHYRYLIDIRGNTLTIFESIAAIEAIIENMISESNITIACTI